MGTLRDEHTAAPTDGLAAQEPAPAPATDAVLVYDLTDVRAGMGDQVGGKAANLGELIAAGFPVPRGFCVSTEAYRAVADLPELTELIEVLNGVTDPAEQARIAALIRELLVTAPVPAELDAAIADAYAKLGRGSAVPVAVRSSATAEDLPFASFAGQQDTYLNVLGADAVRTAVSRCWASLWTDRAVSYRGTNGIDHGTVRLAVVVQHMIDSAVAGVLFTANPVTGRRAESVVDASPGLGEAVVSGAVDPDHFVVDADGSVLQRRLGGKQLAIRPTPGGGTTEVTPTAGSDEACITDAQLRELVALGERVQGHFGVPQDSSGAGIPQDIEWAIDEDGRLWLTQTRPITTLYPLPPPRGAGLRVYFSANVAQGVNQPFTPSGAAGLRALVSSLAGAAGFDIPDPLAGLPAFQVAGDRIFVDLTVPIRSTLGRELVPRLFDVMEARSAVIFRELMTDPRLSLTDRSRWRGLRRVIKAVGHVRAPIWAAEGLLRPDAARRRAFGRAAEIDRLSRVAEGLSAEQRLDEATRLLTEIGGPRMIRVMPLVAMAFGLIGLAPKLSGGVAMPEELRVVQRGIPHNVTTDMDLELGRLAAAIRAEAEAASVLREQPVAELVRRYRDGALPAVAQRGVTAFLDRYGHRAVAEIDLGVPRWSDDPTHVFGMLANYLRVEDDTWSPAAQFAQGAVEAEAMVTELVARTRRERGRFRAWVLGIALHRYRALAGVRELPKYCLVLLMARARTHLAAIGVELAGAGRLDRADDVFFLDLRQVRAAVGGADLRELVAQRRAGYERELRRRHVPRMLLSDGTEPEAVLAAGAQAQEGALVGTAASAGSVTGIARVVLDPVGAHLAPGEILVAPSTDPGWTPLFLTAGGLVMEMGGPNSHGAVVAREYGIPAVVGVPNATGRITTGQTITVNGAAGTVTVDAGTADAETGTGTVDAGTADAEAR